MCQVWPLSKVNQSHFSSPVYGQLFYENGEYVLADKLFMNDEDGIVDNKTSASFKFKIPSLEPAFNTSRVTCKKTDELDSCRVFENKEYMFQYVNRSASDYGDTPLERLRKASKDDGMTAGQVGFAVITLPSLLALGALASPFIAGEYLTREKRVVEFEHNDFADEVKNAIDNSGFNVTAEYFEIAQEVAKAHNAATRRSGVLLDEAVNRSKQRSALLSKYYAGQAPFISAELPTLTEEYGTDSTSILAVKDRQLAALETHYKAEAARISEKYDEIEVEAIRSYKERQVKRFNNIGTSSDAVAFISSYKTLDLAALIPEAKIKKKNLLVAEEKERKRQAKLAEERRIAAEKKRKQQERLAEQRRIEESKKLKQWRSKIQVGTETFCGPVIDINQVMVKIYVKTQLSGYASEAWLNRAELYPPSAGCRNKNGVLSPYS